MQFVVSLLQEKEASDPHHPALLRLLASELKCSTSDIVDFELSVCDTQPGVIGGEPTCRTSALESVSI